jgi:hypothetical protein
VKKRKGECVFCNGYGLTKQHLWPDWLKQILHREGNSHSQFMTAVDRTVPNKVFIKPELIEKQGHIGVRKIRNVCGSCNSGWISRLENKTKPILTKLILGERFVLEEKFQSDIASWVMLMAIMGEYTDKRTQSIPPDDRTYLMIHGVPPSNWTIWCGSYLGKDWNQRYKHLGCAAINKEMVGKIKPKMNTQFSTFGIGKFLVHAVSSTEPDVGYDFRGKTRRLVSKIWPVQNKDIVFPRVWEINDQDADFISVAFAYNSLFFEEFRN